MTNTRLTDPEISNSAIRSCWRTSTSAKARAARQWNAGDGIRRTIRFLEKMDCTILSGHRRVRRSASRAASRSGRRELGAAQRRRDREAQGLRRHRDRRRRGVIIQTPEPPAGLRRSAAKDKAS
jgi:5-oxoprolinase (ATP-hydrolysing)